MASATPIGVCVDDNGEPAFRRRPSSRRVPSDRLSTISTEGAPAAVWLGSGTIGVEGFVGGSDRSVDGGGSCLPNGNVRRGGSSKASRGCAAEGTRPLDTGLALRGVGTPRG